MIMYACLEGKRVARQSTAVSVCVLVDEAAEERQQNDPQIEPRRPVRDVVEVILNALPQRGVAAPAVDLRPAGDPRLDPMPGHVAGDAVRELLDEHRTFRARSYQAHVAEQNVDELRQFIERGLPKETP